MKIASVLLMIVLASSTLLCQTAATKGVEFNHTAIFVQDLSRSADFYEKVIGLERIPEPFHDERHIWFRVGPHSQLHLVGGATGPNPAAVGVHTAFRVASISEFMSHLDQLKIKYRSFDGDGKSTTRPDGIHQIYLQDPDGYWIEVNDDRF